MPKAIRDVYGQTLLNGRNKPDVVVLTQICRVQQTAMSGKHRTVLTWGCGANMVSTAAGLAAAGKSL